MPNEAALSEEERLAAEAALDDVYKSVRGVRPNPDKPKGRTPRNNNKLPGEKTESPVTMYVRSLDGDYRTTAEVAKELGVSTAMVRKLARNRDTKAPSFVAPFGRIRISLYTPEDIAELKEFLGKRKKVFKREDLPPMPEPEALRKSRE